MEHDRRCSDDAGNDRTEQWWQEISKDDAQAKVRFWKSEISTQQCDAQAARRNEHGHSSDAKDDATAAAGDNVQVAPYLASQQDAASELDCTGWSLPGVLPLRLPLPQLELRSADTPHQVMEKIAANRNLNIEQCLAFYRIGTHVTKAMMNPDADNTPTDPLRMFIEGPGGTGKTHAIMAVIDLFKHFNIMNWVEMCAFMGAAASAIKGKTIHSLFDLPVFGGRGNARSQLNDLPEAKVTRLRAIWSTIQYVIVDEISMVSPTLLHHMHQRACAAKRCDAPFGGVNMIFLGDFLQFRPIAAASLVVRPSTLTPRPSTSSASSTTDDAIGYILWHGNQIDGDPQQYGLTDGVRLRQQWRQQGDERYQLLLNNMRECQVTREDYELLQTRLLDPKHLLGTDPLPMNHIDWTDVRFITSVNNMRTGINNEYVRRLCASTHQPLLLSIARDRDAKQRPFGADIKRRLLQLSDTDAGNMPGYLPLIKGLPVIIKRNIVTELTICNGTEGFIDDVIWPPFVVDEAIERSRGINPLMPIIVPMPSVILVRIPNYRFAQLDGLAPGVWPIFPQQTAFTWSSMRNIDLKVKRTHFFLVLGRAITAHGSQGKTMKCMAWDPPPPPSRARRSSASTPSDMADVYVPLSRVRRLKDLVIINPFTIEQLQRKQHPDLQTFYQQLDHLVVRTKTFVDSLKFSYPVSANRGGEPDALQLPSMPASSEELNDIAFEQRSSCPTGTILDSNLKPCWRLNVTPARDKGNSGAFPAADANPMVPEQRWAQGVNVGAARVVHDHGTMASNCLCLGDCRCKLC